MLQWEFAALLAETCHSHRINVVVESALHCPSEHMQAVLAHADYLITDIKHMDSAVHQQLTGVGNERILHNIRQAACLGLPMVVRTPVVAGLNNSEENIRATAAFLREAVGSRLVQYQLLPYRKMGTEKYETMGLPYPMGDYAPPAREEWEQDLLHLRDLVVGEYGLPAVAGSNHKWGQE